MMRTCLLLATLLLNAAAPLSAQRLDPNVSANVFAQPTGPYLVGTFDTLWIDAQRPERYTKDPGDKRHLLVQVWYPADTLPGAQRSRYIRTPAEFGNSSSFKPVEHVLTNSFSAAPFAQGRDTFPVLIYNHGAGWSRFTGTFIVEQLVSHGYVVFSIDHPGRNRSVLFPDGVAFRADTTPGDPPRQDPNGDGRANFLAMQEFMSRSVFADWIDDSRFVLDRIEELSRAPGPFRGRLDLERIGMLGWSFGGAAAIETSRIDRRVKAAVNHDGGLYGGVWTEPTSRPFMLFRHGIVDPEPPGAKAGITMRDMYGIILGYDSTAKALAKGDWYDLKIANTNHGSFSDLPLLVQWSPELLPARRGHEIIGAYTLAFFDQYLKDKKSALLEKPSADFPEVAFRRKQ